MRTAVDLPLVPCAPKAFSQNTGTVSTTAPSHEVFPSQPLSARPGVFYRLGTSALTGLMVIWFIVWWVILAIDDARQEAINRKAGEGEVE